MRRLLNVFVESFALGLAEFRTLYTVRSWLAGWLVRMTAQVAFFGSIGLLLDSSERVQYLLVGNAVVLVCLEATIVVIFVSSERYQGTLELLVSSPTGPAAVFLGRGLNWVVTGIVTSGVTLAVLLPLFGAPLTVGAFFGCVPVLVAIGLSSHFYGSALASITLRYPQVAWLVLNVGYLLVMTLAGVNVAVSYWPAPLEALAQVLPVTHGLEAVRGVIDSASVAETLVGVGKELAVGLGWSLVAAASYEAFVRGARRSGSLSRV